MLAVKGNATARFSESIAQECAGELLGRRAFAFAPRFSAFLALFLCVVFEMQGFLEARIAQCSGVLLRHDLTADNAVARHRSFIVKK